MRARRSCGVTCSSCPWYSSRFVCNSCGDCTDMVQTSKRLHLTSVKVDHRHCRHESRRRNAVVAHQYVPSFAKITKRGCFAKFCFCNSPLPGTLLALCNQGASRAPLKRWRYMYIHSFLFLFVLRPEPVMYHLQNAVILIDMIAQSESTDLAA